MEQAANDVRAVSAKKHRFRPWLLVLSVVICVIMLFPFYTLINLALRGPTDFVSRLKLPNPVILDNFINAFKDRNIWTGLINSVIYAALTVIIEIVCASMAGYSLSRGSARTTRSVRMIQMTIIMVPGIVTLVGTYSVMIRFHMTNSLTSLALLSAASGIPTCAFIYMNFMRNIPIALDEAARIDGAGIVATFFRVILPQLGPITVTRTIMIAIGAWNNYLLPLYLLNDNRKKTSILVVRGAFSGGTGGRNLGLACATCAICILPILVIYCIMQRKIIASQIGSAVKG